MEQVYPKGLQTMGKIYGGLGKKWEEKGLTQMKCYELTTSHIPHPPALLSGEEEVEELGIKEWH